MRLRTCARKSAKSRKAKYFELLDQIEEKQAQRAAEQTKRKRSGKKKAKPSRRVALSSRCLKTTQLALLLMTDWFPLAKLQRIIWMCKGMEEELRALVEQ